MYLRWMVRRDKNGVDFGIWKNISPSQLICPIDVHVARVAKRFNLLHRNAIDWQAAVELTGICVRWIIKILLNMILHYLGLAPLKNFKWIINHS